MNSKLPIGEDQVEALVRAYLLDDSQPEQVARCAAGIQAQLAARARRPRFVWKLAAAACLFLAVGLGGYFALAPDSASAYALVSAAQVQLAKTTDRCYQVSGYVPKFWARKNPFLPVGEDATLWTRGDEFRLSTIRDGHEQVWGQDDRHRLWIVADPRLGLRYERDEVPPIVGRMRSFLAVDLRRLANRFLDDCTLEIERPAKRVRGIVHIQASPKVGKGTMPFTTARMEIEQKTKTIRKLELERVIDGDVKASFTFTLVDQESVPQVSYALEGNLQPDAEILEANHADRRQSLFEELLGESPRR